MRFILPFLLVSPLFFNAAYAQKATSPKEGTMTYFDKIKDAFARLDKNNLQVVDEFYDQNAEFHDPIGSVKTAAKIKAYYGEMYKNVKHIKFDFTDAVQQDQNVAAVWTMTYSTEQLNDGKDIIVHGTSIIKFGGSENKVIYHRDYFDVGSMVYEHIPLLGWGVRKVKSKLGEH